jgi:hypothetical protein
MQYRVLGYYLMCLSPIVSIILWLLVGHFIIFELSPHYDYLFPIFWYIGESVFIIAVQLCGIILYMIGYKRRELEDFPLLLVSGILLTLWGAFASFLVLGFYNHFMWWITQPGRRAITIWDNLQYATWGLEGLLWIASGITIIATDIHERMAQNRTYT